MKTWNIPSVEEIDVKLTASGYNPDTYENDGQYVGDYVCHDTNTKEYVITGTNLGGVIEGCVADLTDPRCDS